jgi:tetratricopeptide (TPR) repeat protein
VTVLASGQCIAGRPLNSRIVFLDAQDYLYRSGGIMKNISSIGLFSLILLLSGCAGFQAAREVNSGRQAYLIGNNEVAYAHFQKAAQVDPSYVYGTALRQGIWSYVGRVNYDMGRLPQAREALERALTANREEDLARLYFGLALAREGDRQRGLKEIEGGLRGVHQWLEYVDQNQGASFGRFWDPAREIRSAIQTDLGMISGRDIDWPKLIAAGEWVGKRMEVENDRASRDETIDRNRENDGGGGEEP